MPYVRSEDPLLMDDLSGSHIYYKDSAATEEEKEMKRRMKKKKKLQPTKERNYVEDDEGDSIAGNMPKSFRRRQKKIERAYHEKNHNNQGFYFKPKREKLNWKVLMSIDMDKLQDDIDIDTLESIAKNVTFSKIDAHEFRYFSEDNFVHLFGLSQLIIEYLLYVQQYLSKKKEELERDVETILDDLDRYRCSLIKKNEEINYLKKDLKRQKKTIFAYQLVFGASPEKARIMFNAMQQGGVNHGQLHSPREEKRGELTDQKNFLEIKQEMRSIMKDLQKLKHMKMDNEEEKIRQLESHLERLNQDMKTELKVKQDIEAMGITRKIEESLSKRDAALLDIIDQKINQISENLTHPSTIQRELEGLRLQIKNTQDVIRKSMENKNTVRTYQVRQSPVKPRMIDVKPKEIEVQPKVVEVQQPKVVEVRPKTPPIQETIAPTFPTPQKSMSPKKPIEKMKPHQEKVRKSKKDIDLELNEENLDKIIYYKVKEDQILKDFSANERYHPLEDEGKPYIESRFPFTKDFIDVSRRKVFRAFENNIKLKGFDSNMMNEKDYKKQMNVVLKNREDDEELKQVVEEIRKQVNEISKNYGPKIAKRSRTPKSTSNSSQDTCSSDATSSQEPSEEEESVSNYVKSLRESLSSTHTRRLGVQESQQSQNTSKLFSEKESESSGEEYEHSLPSVNDEVEMKRKKGNMIRVLPHDDEIKENRSSEEDVAKREVYQIEEEEEEIEKELKVTQEVFNELSEDPKPENKTTVSAFVAPTSPIPHQHKEDGEGNKEGQEEKTLLTTVKSEPKIMANQMVGSVDSIDELSSIKL